MSVHLPDRFGVYRREWDPTKQKWGKVPCDHHGINADPSVAANWMTFDAASQIATWDETRPSAPYGVSFYFNGDGWFFLDLDNCRDTAGDWTSEADTIYRSFGGALGEMSTSGNRLHIIGRCDPSKLRDRRNKWGGDKEFYHTGRFVALSQAGLQPIMADTYRDTDWTTQLLHVVPERPFLGDLPDGRDEAYTGPEDDDELIGMILRSSSTAAAFGDAVTAKDMWEANTEALAKKYPAYDGNGGFDHSSADAALMSILAFWTGKDMPRMDRLFRRSALMRDKYEKRADYRRSTIEKAARLCTRVYSKQGRDTANAVPDHDPWPKPAPRFLGSELPAAPHLDLRGIVTPSLAEWITCAAESKGAPPDYVFAALLAVAGSTLGNSRWVSPWEGWQEPPVLWVMCIGLPSAGKSPAIDAALQPLREAERPLRQSAEVEAQEWAEKAELAKLIEQQWKADAKQALKESQTPAPKPHGADPGAKPHIPRLVVNDGTIERLGMILADQRRGTLQMRDELAGWLNGMERYSGATDRTFWLEAFGGRGFTVERVGREPLTIDRLSIGVLGGIQPDRLSSLLFKCDNDGLLARFLPIWPEPVPLRRPNSSADEMKMTGAISRLLSLSLIANEDGSVRPWIVPFENGARSLMDELRSQVREWEAENEGLMLSFIGKLPGLAARLALVMAHLNWAFEGGQEPREVTEAQFKAAKQMIETYFMPMASRAYADANVPKSDRAAQKLLAIVRERDLNSFTTREIMRLEQSGLGRKDQLDPAVVVLEDGGCIRVVENIPTKKGGRPTRRYAVNPLFLKRGA